MNIAPISEPKTMIPAQAATQKIAPRGDLEVVERVRGPALAEHEGAGGGERDQRRARSPASPLPGTGAKLIASTSAATSTIERMPPRLSTGSVVSLTWAGT